MTLIEIISELYKRKYDNPLYFLMRDEKYKNFLDNKTTIHVKYL